MVQAIWVVLLPTLAVVSGFNSYRSQFLVPDCRLQAGYPRGMRVWIPDATGIEKFTFHGQLNSPLLGQETGGLVGRVLSPVAGNWVFQVDGLQLQPGDVVYFWTFVVYRQREYSRPNQTWTVPSREKFVDLKSPLPFPVSTETTPTNTTEETTSEVDKTTQTPTTTTEDTTSEVYKTTQTPTTNATTEGTTSEVDKTTQTPTTTTEGTTSEVYKTTQSESLITTASEGTTESSDETTEALTTVDPSMTESPTTTTTEESTKLKYTTGATRPAETEATKPTLPTPGKRSTTERASENRTPDSELAPPKGEDDVEPTTPTPDKPVSEFSEEPAFPPLFPGPYRPMMPPQGPGFEICSNPWNFLGKEGETKTEKLERQVAKLQCDLAMFQRKFSQLGSIMANELDDIKKLNYNMVSRMGRLEQLLRGNSPWP